MHKSKQNVITNDKIRTTSLVYSIVILLINKKGPYYVVFVYRSLQQEAMRTEYVDINWHNRLVNVCSNIVFNECRNSSLLILSVGDTKKNQEKTVSLRNTVCISKTFSIKS